MRHALYRPDIDGLRAIAVSAVLLFHIFPSWLRGGFVGVDVFFVISGFLISSGIFKEVDDGRFSYLKFYARRVRRIFPALALVLIVSLGLGWALLLPEEYKVLGKHVTAGVGFLSNIVLWKESGYFDTAAELKPLLHLWSLGIEEQFYIVWPVAASLLLLRKGWFAALLGLAGIASFACNITLVERYPTATFYLPVTRFWELLAGAGLAYQFHRGRQLALRNDLAGVGLVLLLVSLVWTPSAGFPGWWAAMPVAGTYLLIATGPETVIGRRLLGSRLFVFVGVISYPLYLWHWPLLAFARLANMSVGRLDVGLALMTLSVLLAWLTYLFIERPVRTKHATARTALALAGLMTAVGAAGFASMRGDAGWIRLGSLSSTAGAPVPELAPPGGVCQTPSGLPLGFCSQSQPGSPKAALFGDSHAHHHYAGLARVDDKRNWLLIGHTSCPPVNGIDIENYSPQCRERTEYVTRYLAEQRSIELVVLAFYGGYFLTTDVAADHIAMGFGPSRTRVTGSGMEGWSREQIFFAGLGRTVERLEAAGKRVVVIISGPELPFFPRNRVRLAFTAAELKERLTIKRAEVLARQAPLRKGLLEMQRAHAGLRVFDVLDWLCDGPDCCLVKTGGLTYQDSHHLSDLASDLVARQFLRWLAPSPAL